MHKYVERGNKTQLRLFQFLQKSDKGQIFYWSRETAGSDQMKKTQKKLTLSKIDFLSSVIIIGLD